MRPAVVIVSGVGNNALNFVLTRHEPLSDDGTRGLIVGNEVLVVGPPLLALLVRRVILTRRLCGLAYTWDRCNDTTVPFPFEKADNDRRNVPHVAVAD